MLKPPVPRIDISYAQALLPSRSAAAGNASSRGAKQLVARLSVVKLRFRERICDGAHGSRQSPAVPEFVKPSSETFEGFADLGISSAPRLSASSSLIYCVRNMVYRRSYLWLLPACLLYSQLPGASRIIECLSLSARRNPAVTSLAAIQHLPLWLSSDLRVPRAS